MQPTADAATSLELEEYKAKINILDSTTINPPNPIPKDDNSSTTNQDVPMILPKPADPYSNESTTVALATYCGTTSQI